MLSARIFNIWEVKRIALTILFRFTIRGILLSRLECPFF